MDRYSRVSSRIAQVIYVGAAVSGAFFLVGAAYGLLSGDRHVNPADNAIIAVALYGAGWALRFIIDGTTTSLAGYLRGRMGLLDAFGKNLALGWVIYLALFAMNKHLGGPVIYDPVGQLLGRAGAWGPVIMELIGASLPLLGIGFLVRRSLRRGLGRLNAWLEQPLSAAHRDVAPPD